MIQVIYYREKCIGCNSCADLFPYRWSISEEDGKSNLADAIVKRGAIHLLETSNDEEEDFNTASESCPVGIIEVNVLR